MPDQPAAGAADEQTATAAQGADNSGADASEGQSQGQSAKEAASREAAKYRVKLREAEVKLKQLADENEALKSSRVSPDVDEGKVAKLERTLSELQNGLKQERELRQQAENASKEEKLNNALRKAAAEAQVFDPDDAIIVMRNKGRARISKDGMPVFVITEDGEEREIEIAGKTVKDLRLLSERFFPAEGAAGSGSRGGSRNANASGVDFERGLKDPAYFAANEKAMKEELRRRNS